MAIDVVAKKKFNEEITELKSQIADIDKKVQQYRRDMRKDEKLVPFYRIAIAGGVLEQAQLRLKMNISSETLMNVKNHSYIDEGRKALSKAFTEIGEIVTLRIDEPLDFNREFLDRLKPFSPKKRLNLLKHLKRTLEEIIVAYGENSKWQWSFPDLWYKVAVIGKNIIDYREIQAIRDPREKYYYIRQELLEITKSLLFEVSNQFRNKYEISTKSNDDLRYAIRLLSDLKRIASLMGDPELAKKAKAGIESYKARIESEEAKKDKKKVKKKRSKK